MAAFMLNWVELSNHNRDHMTYMVWNIYYLTFTKKVWQILVLTDQSFWRGAYFSCHCLELLAQVCKKKKKKQTDNL